MYVHDDDDADAVDVEKKEDGKKCIVNGRENVYVA